MEDTVIWTRQQKTLTIVDRLATDEPGSLNSCSFSDLGDAFHDIKGSDHLMLSYYLSDYVQNYWSYMPEPNNNDELPKRAIHMSHVLNGSEQDSVREYVGKNSALLACGVCQLLKEEDEKWTFFAVGVICFIRDYDNRVCSLSLIEPSPDGSSANVIWFTQVARDFMTTKNHSHLISFELKDALYGLNFAEEDEAESFHNTVTQTREEYLMRRSMRNKPKRRAPLAPTEQLAPINEQINVIDETTSKGIEIPIIRGEKKKKKGLFSGISRLWERDKSEEKKNKKKKFNKKLTISNPTNFQHVQHGFEDLPDEQKKILNVILEKVEVEPGNKDQLTFLRKTLEENYDVIKKEVEANKEEAIKEENNEHQPFQRSQSNGLSDARSSIKLAKINRTDSKDYKRPKSIKKHSNNRKQEGYDPLRPNWDEDTPSHPSAASQLGEKHPLSKENYSPPMERRPPPQEVHPLTEQRPPLPSRTESRRPPLNRQNTPPYRPNAPLDDAPPRLPPRLESVHRDNKSQVTPIHPPTSLAAPIVPPISITAPPAPPPPPSSFVVPKVNPPSKLPPPRPPNSSISISVDPPTSLPASSSLPSVTNDRRSFLEEIQSVDKSKLLRPVDRSPSRNDVTPTEQGLSIISQIQKELDSRRTMMNSSSEDDSSSSDESESWSD